MKSVSKLCPSDGSSEPAAQEAAERGSSATLTRRPLRVFRNSYTRGGRRFETGGWVVKVQHQGQRRTFSLRAKTKAAAASEAKAIRDILLTDGWCAALRNYANSRTAGVAPFKGDINYWRERLMVRRYGFPSSNGTGGELAVRIDQAGTGFWFPLGTTAFEVGAAKAAQIFETAVKQGWEECCRRFSRELIVGFEWCSNPILWTYTTVHTIVGEQGSTPVRGPKALQACRVLIVEQDAGVRRALERCINQQTGFQSSACGSPATFSSMLKHCSPGLVLLNRNLTERLGFASPGQIATISGTVPALTYSVAVDGDQLFVSTPGGAEGYLLKRVKPDRFLEPVLAGNLPIAGLGAGELLPRVKGYFKGLLQPHSDGAGSGVARLTRRETEVLGLLSKGCVDKEIAQALGISAWTVHGHIKSIFERLGVRTRTEAVVRYLEK